MLNLQEGDEVEIVALEMDADEQFKIGDVTTIIEVATNPDGHPQPYLLKCVKEDEEEDFWWVTAACVILNNLSLENE